MGLILIAVYGPSFIPCLKVYRYSLSMDLVLLEFKSLPMGLVLIDA